MRQCINILALAFAILLTSCGTKKPVTTTHADVPQEQQDVQEETMPTDTLPDFLKEFANDSTIHINWAYGIPFIIDDSVPMFLSSIDKNPEGYVSKGFSGIGNNRCKKQMVLGLYSPMDSILWLNKCLHDTYDYVMNNMVDIPSSYTYDYNWTGIAYSISNSFFDTKHVYYYVVKLISMNDRYCFQILFEQQQQGMQSSELANYAISYFFDIEGTLLGKMHITRPKHWSRPRKESVIYLRTSIPDYNLFISNYIAKYKCSSIFYFIIQPFGPMEE